MRLYILKQYAIDLLPLLKRKKNAHYILFWALGGKRNCHALASKTHNLFLLRLFIVVYSKVWINYEGATGAILHITGGSDMTLEEINRVGELVTASMDTDANVIWGARIDDNMKGKLMVMTIITGVNSPWILGKRDNQQKQSQEELGIEMI